MTVPATTRRAGPFTGNGSTTVFPFSFKVFTQNDIQVQVELDGISSTLVLGTDYSVSVNPDQESSPGGSITYPLSGSPLAVGDILVVLGAVPYDQTTDFPDGGNYRAQTHENALDRIVFQIQQLVENLGRALVLPGIAGGVSTVLPVPEANKLIGWNADADGLQNFDASTLASLVAYGTANADIFSGDGSTLAFTLSENPVDLHNLDVAIGGVVQRPGIDYFWSGGTSIAFATAPASGTNNILVRYMQGLPEGSGGTELPSQVGQANKTLSTSGTALDWRDVEGLYGTAAGTGALRRSMASRFRDGGANVLDFIPEAEHAGIRAGSSTYDCRPGIQAAIDSLGLKGGRVYIPKGTYEVSKNPDEQCCIIIQCPIILEGDGYFSVIKPKSDVGALTNTISFVPSPIIDCSQSVIRHIHIGDPNTGTRAGHYGIFLDTQATDAYLPELTISDIFVGESGQHAIAHLHDPNRSPAGNGINGGLYGCTIEGCQLRGGIRLDNSGDSINILRNVISGEQIGVYASIIAGASQLHIVGNNITSTQGAIKLDRAGRPHIVGNNIEQTVVGNANASAMVNLAGGNGLIVQPIVVGNNMGAFSGTGIVRAIKFGAGEGGLVQDNSFLPSSSTQYGIAVFGAWTHLRVGWNQYGTDSLYRVEDNGIGTMGTARSFQGLLQNSWVTHGSNYADCYYFKDHLGFVEIHGSIKNGTLGTLASPVELFTLPEDYRPAKSENAVCYSQDSSPAVQDAAILVNASAGTVFMIKGANGIFSFNCRFQAAKPALTDIRYGSSSSGYGYGAGHTSNN